MSLSFKDKLKNLRKERGLTLDELAIKTSSNKSYIWELENPRNGRKPITPSIDKLTLIADALSVTIDYFLRDDLNKTQEMEKEAFYRKFSKLTSDDQKRIDDMMSLWGK